MATLKLNKKTAGPPGSGNKRNADGERRAPIRGKGVSRPRQSLEAAKAEREQRQAQFEQREQKKTQRYGDTDRPRAERPSGPGGPGGRPGGRPDARPGGPGQRPPARDGWRNEGPRFESRHEGRSEGRGDGRGDGRNEGRNEGRFDHRGDNRFDNRSAPRYEGRPDPRRDGGGRPEFRDSRDSRDAQRPRYEDRRPGFGQAPQGPRRHPDERGAPGPREDRWQGQRPSYAQEPRREGGGFGGGSGGGFGGPRGEPRGGYRDSYREGYRDAPRENQRPGSNEARPEFARQDQRRHSGGPGYNTPRPSAQSRAGEQLPAHLREAAAKLRRQLDEGDDGDDRDEVFVDANSEGVRLSKQMGVLGLASRREADEWIAAGWVRVDGKLAALGQRVKPDAKIEVDPLAHKEQAKRVTILLHKPIGYVSGQAEDGYEPASVLIKSDAQWSEDSSGIKYHIGHSRGLAPAGRLDIDSTGLLVLTQDGRIAKLLIGEDSTVEKEYLVRVEYQGRNGVKSEDGRLPAEDLALLNHGLELDGVQLKPAKVSWQNEDQLRFVLREGRKRQIRRMCELVGLKVVGLKRVRIGRINLGNLPVGQWRFLTPWERFD